MGSGVRRLAVPLPALLSPSAFGSIGFDDLSQAYQWEVRDDAGDSLVLSIPADDDESALRLWRLGNRILAIVVEARLDRQAMEIRPVSVLQRDRSRIAVHNVDFDHWPVESGVRKVISTISESVAKPLATAQIVTDPIDQVVSDAAEELASIVSGSTRTKSESIGRRLEACGLVTLSDILGRAALTDDLHVALTAAYVTSELKAILALQHRS